MEIKNLKKAAKRIKAAIQDNERIILYGDADPDGAASTVILKEAIEQIAEKKPVLTIYFPDREKENYGINELALNYLSKKAPALLIALDCGIGNVKEVEKAKEMDFEVIIVDHHQVPPGALPPALVVNPKQKDDKYEFKYLACVGVVYKLVVRMLSESEDYKPEQFLPLVALATISDQMPLEQDNKKLVKDGILALGYTKRPSLRILMEEMFFTAPTGPSQFQKKDYIEKIKQKLLPPLNAARVKNHINEAYSFLIETSLKKARKQIKALKIRTKQRREDIKAIFQEIEARILVKPEQSFIFEGVSAWPLAYLGPVASKICQLYKKPCFLYKKTKDLAKGACRSPSGVDIVAAMNSCSALFETYGGHAPAAGFTIKNKNLKSFEQCLSKYFEEL